MSADPPRAPAGVPQWCVDLEAHLAERRSPAAGGGGMPPWGADVVAEPGLALVDDEAGARALAARGLTVARRGAPLPDGPFGTALLNGVLETTPDAEALLAAVDERLADGGRLVVHARLGLSDDPGCRRVLHPTSLVGLCQPRFTVTRLTVEDGALRLLATRGGDGEPGAALLGSLLPALEEALHAAEVRALRLEARAEREHIRRVEAVHAVEAAHAARGTVPRAEAERLTERAARLERERERLLAALEEAREEQRRIRERRWWQLGEVLTGARNPRGLLRLPRDAYRVVAGRDRKR